MVDRRERDARSVTGLRTLRRAATATTPAFDLAYVRRRPTGGPVVLEIPGGPGLAVPLPYHGFRERAARAGLDVLMVEHRGIGLSRRDTAGRDLPADAIRIAEVVRDLRAVLDAEGVDRAIVSGASYGSYVAAAFATTYPERTAALVLDSTVLTATDHVQVRRHARSLLWEGRDARSAHLARKIRILVERDGHDPMPLGNTARILFEFGGAALLERYLDQFVLGRAHRTTRQIRSMGEREVREVIPHVMEGDLVAHIAYGELDYAPQGDGKIFDPAVSFATEDAPPFRGEEFDLPTQLRRIESPAVILSGDRDLRTPRPVAERAAQTLPDATLVPLPEQGHSVLDTRPGALIDVLHAVALGRHEDLSDRGAELVANNPVTGTGRALPLIVRALLASDRLTTPFPRVPRGLQ